MLIASCTSYGDPFFPVQHQGLWTTPDPMLRPPYLSFSDKHEGGLCNYLSLHDLDEPIWIEKAVRGLHSESSMANAPIRALKKTISRYSRVQNMGSSP